MKLTDFFRTEQVTTWQDFARELGGNWHAPEPLGHGTISVKHGTHDVRIEGHVTVIPMGKMMMPVVTTRFSTTLPSVPAQRFSVTRASFASAVAHWFGALDIQVDDQLFDDAFVLKGETPDVVRQLFADESLRKQYHMHFEGQLHRHDDRGLMHDSTPGIDPLTLDVTGLVEEPARLRALYSLFVATLDRVA